MSEDSKNMSQENQEKKTNRKKVLWIVIAAMLLLNGFLAIQYFRKSSQQEETKKELISSEQLRSQLQDELSEYEDQVANLEGQVDELDTVLAQNRKELEARAEKIRKLLAENRITTEKYQKALKELETLRYYKKKYQFQIDSLVRVNKVLVEENENLRGEVKEQKIKASKLKDENVNLENKVALGSRLEAKSIKATGIKIKNNGSEKETDKTSQMDQLKVCFTLAENVIADKGKRQIFIKVVDPNGETLYIKGAGSGEFDYRGQQSLYTVKKTIVFDNKPAQHCATWLKGSEFSEGIYIAELYTDGYMIGKQEFELKSGFSLF